MNNVNIGSEFKLIELICLWSSGFRVLDLHFWSKPHEDSFTNPRWRECSHSLWNSHRKTCRTSLWNTQENGHTQLRWFPVSAEARKHHAIDYQSTTSEPFPGFIMKFISGLTEQNCLTNPGKWLIHVFRQLIKVTSKLVGPELIIDQQKTDWMTEKRSSQNMIAKSGFIFMASGDAYGN